MASSGVRHKLSYGLRKPAERLGAALGGWTPHEPSDQMFAAQILRPQEIVATLLDPVIGGVGLRPFLVLVLPQC